LARPAVGAAAPAYQVISLGVLPGDTGSAAWSINDRAEVLGVSYSTLGTARVFYWSQATGMLDTGVVPGFWGPPSQPLMIADTGEVAGTLTDSAGADHAFVWSLQGGLTDLGTLPGDTSSRVVGIDAIGRVAGTSVG